MQVRAFEIYIPLTVKGPRTVLLNDCAHKNGQ